MTTIAEMYRRFSTVNLREAVPGIIAGTKDQLAELNKDQLRHGFDKNGERLIPYASLTYAIDKNNANPLAGFGNPDLYDTGRFYNGWRIDVTKTEIIFDSTDSKTPALEDKYGSNIFGLTIESKQQYINTILYDLIKKHIQEKTRVAFV